jgi:exodeoxyribonuclease VII large subunit
MQTNKQVLSVSEVNRLLFNKIENDLTFQLMLVVGEIVNYKEHSSGHRYFILKDEESRLKCVMFRGQASYLTFRPKNGQKVLAQGRLSIYEKYGEYQLYIDSLHPIGAGDFKQKYIELKNKLSSQGYFEDKHKKELPKFPKSIGVITSSTGAVIHDIIRTVKERYPVCELLLVPVNVQGAKALGEIIQAFDILHNQNVDVVILGRGGGSEEELWVFNEELLVKKIFDYQIPVVTAIGHEIDITLSDLVADKSAATPTAAAVMVVPNIEETIRDIDYLQASMQGIVNDKIKNLYEKLGLQSRMLKLYEPKTYLQRLNSLIVNAESLQKRIMQSKINEYKSQLDRITIKINESYYEKANYPKVYDLNLNREINTIEDIVEGSQYNVFFKDGKVLVKTISKEALNYGKINN